jgi:hypothetical protein
MFFLFGITHPYLKRDGIQNEYRTGLSGYIQRYEISISTIPNLDHSKCMQCTVLILLGIQEIKFVYCEVRERHILRMETYWNNMACSMFT